MEFSLATIASPQTQYFGFWRVGHVDEVLKPPPFGDGTVHGPDNESVVTDLHETEVARGSGALVHGETVPVQESGAEWFEVDVVAVLGNWQIINSKES